MPWLQLNNNSIIKIMAAAGGTGGHLFPATAVVEQLQNISGNMIRPIFIGTDNKIESKVIPQLGYEFHPIPISGYTGINFSALTLPFKVVKSLMKCRSLIRKTKPHAVICTGAYISYPVGQAAFLEGVPLILMESNVMPGKTIKMLASKADLIITSFDASREYYSQDIKAEVVNLGNPVRQQLFEMPSREKALEKIGLRSDRRTVFVFGGSLGAMSINQSIEKILDEFTVNDIQLIWQTGGNYKYEGKVPNNVIVEQFMDDMSLYYAAADLVVSRSGATTVAELGVIGKPSILVPLPSASNNEQLENAKIFSGNGASILLPDEEVPYKLLSLVNEVINDDKMLGDMSKNALELGKPKAARQSADKIIELIEFFSGKGA
jgi:UDP-N-acetylglucosamine--N-acetylmuramyl-(pentapeptide) pyrophosphoryl-undecaprenol N-acetylglucosamine transferase